MPSINDSIEWRSDEEIRSWYNEWVCFQADLFANRPNTVYPYEIPFGMAELEREMCRRRNSDEVSSN